MNSKKEGILNNALILSGFVLTGIAWLYVAFTYGNLPDQVVAHMDLQGNVNRYDSKATLWFLLAIFTGLQIILMKLGDSTAQWSKNESAKTTSLFALPYLGLMIIGLCYLMIQKTLDLSFNDTPMMIFFGIITVLLVGAVFVHGLKTQKK